MSEDKRGICGILSVSCGYIAAIIGAGFASGQEIVLFFLKYGKGSIIGVLLACVIFSLFEYAVLGACVRLHIHSYEELLGCFFGPRTRQVARLVTAVFALVCVSVMTACAGEMAYTLFGMNFFAAALIFAVLTALTLLGGAARTMRVNAVLGCVTIFGITLCCFYILRFREHQVFYNTLPMTFSSVSYAGYNLITGGAVIANMSRYIHNKKDALLSSAASGCTLFIIMTLIWITLGIYYGKINLGEIPMLTMALRQGKALGAVYAVMLFLAVFTTAVSNGFAAEDILRVKCGEKNAALIIFAFAVLFSGAGFERLIDNVYRICGYAGAALVFAVIYKSLKKQKTVINKRITKKIKENAQKY